jgi:hypothetical protein
MGSPAICWGRRLTVPFAAACIATGCRLSTVLAHTSLYPDECQAIRYGAFTAAADSGG